MKQLHHQPRKSRKRPRYPGLGVHLNQQVLVSPKYQRTSLSPIPNLIQFVVPVDLSVVSRDAKKNHLLQIYCNNYFAITYISCLTRIADSYARSIE